MEFIDSRGNIVPLSEDTHVGRRVSGYAVVTNGNDMYLTVQSGDGLWHFPGGAVEADETPQEAAVRECAEETGYRVTISETEPLYRREQGFYHTREQAFYHAVQLFYRGDLVQATPGAPTDSDPRPVAWMRLDDLSHANAHQTIHKLLDKLKARKKPA